MHDGTINYNFPTIIKSLCKVDVTFFPFDVQVCRFKFGSWMHHGFDLNLSMSAKEGMCYTLNMEDLTRVVISFEIYETSLRRVS